MKRKKLLPVVICSVYVTLLLATGAQAQTICENETGTHDGYYYELWREGGEACMTLKAGGSFSCEWDDVGNSMSRKGRIFTRAPHQEIGDITVHYGCLYQPEGNSYLGVYGRFTDPFAEYYIIDSWGPIRPPEDGHLGTITVDGGTYDIYQTIRSMPGISVDPVWQYWSVRRTKRTSGTISVSEHFKAWENLEMRLGKLSDVTVIVEGIQSSGKADIYYMSLDIIDNDGYTEITAPFIQDGAGSYTWKTTSIPNYILSWNVESITINGVDITNTWLPSSNMPDKNNGYYYIEYKALYTWSHLEVK